MEDTRARTGPGQRSYQDFTPRSEWSHDAGSDTLLVDLPGFRKEQLKVQVDSHGNLRVNGEGQLNGNQWSRFSKDFRIPDNSNLNEVRAKFDDGVLFVIFPKLITEQDSKPQPPKTQVPPATQSAKNEQPVKNPGNCKPASPTIGTADKPAAGLESTESASARKETPKMPEKEKEKNDEGRVDEKITGDKKETKEPVNAEPKVPAEGVTSNGSGQRFPEMFKYESGNLSFQVNRPRQLLVNVLVAVLVLVGLGFYITCQLKKSPETMN